MRADGSWCGNAGAGVAEEVESAQERVDKVLAKLLPSIDDELRAIYYYLESLPGSLQPEARNRAASLKMRMKRLQGLLEERK